ncbi:hypothetical protein JCM10213v2_006117 [Rhodosporidiobolus nylandii]
MSLKTSSTVTIEWRVEGVNELLAKAKKRQQGSTARSPTFGHGRWLIEFSEDGEKERFGCYLYATPVSNDWSHGSSRHKWSRPGTYDVTFEAKTVDGGSIGKQLKCSSLSFCSASRVWGLPGLVKWAELEKDKVKTPNAIIITSTVTMLELDNKLLLPSIYASYSGFLHQLFNQPTISDVVFTLVHDPTKPPLRFFCMKRLLAQRAPYFKSLFESGMAESSKVISLDVQPPPKIPLFPFYGDPEEFTAFASFKPDIAEDGNMEQEAEEEKAAALATAGSVREFFEVKVEGFSYATYRALLLWLYNGQTSFALSISDFLVAKEDADSKVFSLRDRDKWVKEERADKDLDLEACNPHAVYRLADRYLLDKLKALAKTFLLRSLTAENVAYEVFSNFGRDFEEVQNEEIAFMLDNWNDVKASKAFKHVLKLLAAGELPGGADILARIFDGLDKKQEKKD